MDGPLSRKLVALALSALAFGAACGGSPNPNAGAVATVSASQSPIQPAANGLIVLMSSDANSTMSLRLVSTKGKVVASAQFTPPPPPAYGPCATLLQPPVRVAGGAAFFADSAGVVRKLTTTGAITKVATFQQIGRAHV